MYDPCENGDSRTTVTNKGAAVKSTKLIKCALVAGVVAAWRVWSGFGGGSWTTAPKATVACCVTDRCRMEPVATA